MLSTGHQQPEGNTIGYPNLRLDRVRNILAISQVNLALRVLVSFTWLTVLSKGWLLAAGWQGSVVGLSFIAGTIIQGLITLNNANYVPQQWHGTLLVMAVVSFAIIFNTGFAKKLPLIEGLILLIHIVGLFATVVPLWVLAPRNTARVALLQLSNGGDWPTIGVAFMVGLLTSLGSMLGFDCAVHMCTFPPFLIYLECKKGS